MTIRKKGCQKTRRFDNAGAQVMVLARVMFCLCPIALLECYVLEASAHGRGTGFGKIMSSEL